MWILKNKYAVVSPYASALRSLMQPTGDVKDQHTNCSMSLLYEEREIPWVLVGRGAGPVLLRH